MKIRILLFLFILSGVSIYAQTEQPATIGLDSTAQVKKALPAQTLVASADSTEDLLPTKYPFTQRMLWGKKGLLRNFSTFKLSEDERDREMQIRHKMLTAHRYLSYVSLVGMLAEGIVGMKLYNGDNSLRDLHSTLAAVVNITYFTSAGLALFAPPRGHSMHPGMNALKAHEALAVIHFSAMIATNLLAPHDSERDSGSGSNTKALHRAAAITAFGALFTSMIVVTF
ncbi:MAG: hypothetical protein P4L28_07140 [Paludibacteraceae bacterium]|nr:hypothetical protein [Paludibacteraceae bacterium]